MIEYRMRVRGGRKVTAFSVGAWNAIGLLVLAVLLGLVFLVSRVSR